MLAILNLGGWEIVLILVLILLLFGAKRLPKVAKGLGESVKEFKKIGRDSSEGAQDKTDEGGSLPSPGPTSSLRTGPRRP